MLRKAVVGSFVIFLIISFIFIFYVIQIAKVPKVDPANALPMDEFNYEEEIVKDGDNFFIISRLPEKHYEGKNMIGNSKVDLEPFIGKKVKIERDLSRVPKNASYPIMAKEQCIRNKCHPIFKENPKQESEVFDISSITIVNLKK